MIEIKKSNKQKALIVNENTTMILFFNNIGSQYLDFHKYDKALIFFKYAEQELANISEEEDENVPIWYIVSYMNIIYAYNQLQEYDKSELYIQKAMPYMELEENKKYSFSFQMVQYDLLWRLGRTDEVVEKVEEIVEGICESSNSFNYIQDVQMACELLESMQAYRYWGKVLDSFEEYAKKCPEFLCFVECYASGKNDDVLEDLIFKPLKMLNTKANYEGETKFENRAYGHIKKRGKFVQKDQYWCSATIGDGGIYSNIDDLKKWLYYLHTTDYKTLNKTMFKPNIIGDVNTEYGYGIRNRVIKGYNVIYHCGSTIGTRTIIGFIKELDVEFIFLTNIDGIETSILIDNIINDINKKAIRK